MLQWLLPYCRNLHTFIDSVKWGRPDVGLNEFLQLKNLRNLSISIPTPIQLYEVVVQLLIIDRTYLPLYFVILDFPEFSASGSTQRGILNF
jgi:hypothetical protein